jgi:uncharacterized protein YbbK (DUF523 family)
MYIVSGCLLGYDCKYNGGNNKNDAVIEFCKTHDYVTICPEIAGGLESPRPPAEIVSKPGEELRVVTRDGVDLTRQFSCGATQSIETVMKDLSSRGEAARIEGAILKANSPLCGSGVIYDGSFTGTKTKGYGVFAAALIKALEKERNASGNFVAHCSFAEYFKIVDENGVSELVNK